MPLIQNLRHHQALQWKKSWVASLLELYPTLASLGSNQPKHSDWPKTLARSSKRKRQVVGIVNFVHCLQALKRAPTTWELDFEEDSIDLPLDRWLE